MNITVTLADGRSAEVPAGTPARDAMRAAGADRTCATRWRRGSTAASSTSTGRCRRAARSSRSPPTRRTGTDVLRHSTAHLMAQAVKRLFPETQVTIGPVIEDGFYYDFKKATPFTPEDLERIEAEMRAIVKSDFRVTREEMPRQEAIALFAQMGEALQGRDHRGHSRAGRVAVPPGRVRRPLPRPARAVDRRAQGGQAHRRRRRLLARRRAQRDAAAHLRHRLREPASARGAPGAHRGGEEARPSPARQGARPLHASTPSRPAARSSTPRARSSTTSSSPTCAGSTSATATTR